MLLPGLSFPTREAWFLLDIPNIESNFSDQYRFRYVWIVTLPFIALPTFLVLLLHPVHSDMTATIDRTVERIGISTFHQAPLLCT